MYLLHFLVGIAATSVATAQFIFPDASSSLRLKTAIEIQWNTAALQPPLAINLVPAGSTIRQDIIIQQIGGMYLHICRQKTVVTNENSSN